jgi:hypothetical protein
MHLNLSAAIAAASLLFAHHAMAASLTLMSFDVDRDGYVARTEFIAALRQRFDGMDGDRSGRVSKSELRGFAFKQMTASPRDPLFAPPRGSRLAKPPFEAKDEMDFETFSRDLMRVRFDPLDRDRDGRLSAVEVGK